MIKSYGLRDFTNKGKIEDLKTTLQSYQATATAVAKDQWSLFFKTGKFNKFNNFQKLRTELSARFLQTIRAQVVGQLEGFTSNLKNEIKALIHCSSLSEEQKLNLFIINKYKLWFSIPQWFGKKNPVFLTESDLSLARKLFHQALKLNRRPNFKNCNMVLDNKVCEIHKIDSKKAKSFDFWLRVSTFKKGHPVWVPLNKNSYFLSKKGKLKKAAQINLNKYSKELEFKLVKDLPKQKKTLSSEVIGIDLGFAGGGLLHDNFGNHYGQKFLDLLLKKDQELQRIIKARAKLGFKKYSKRMKVLLRKIKSLIKNEINRIINRILELYSPKQFVLEKLNFQTIRGSRALNRLMNRFGKAILGAKLKSISEEFGVKILEINPAYSSQECSNCNYIDPRNRKNRDKFECRACGFSHHADTNAGKTLKGRSSCPELIQPLISKSKVLSILVKKYLNQNRERLRGLAAPNPRPNSWAEVLKKNKYFSEELKLLEIAYILYFSIQEGTIEPCLVLSLCFCCVSHHSRLVLS